MSSEDHAHPEGRGCASLLWNQQIQCPVHCSPSENVSPSGEVTECQHPEDVYS